MDEKLIQIRRNRHDSCFAIPQFTRMLMIDRCVMSVLTRLIEVCGHKEGNKTDFNIRI